MSRIFATVSDLNAAPWSLTALSAADAARMLAFASRLVSHATMSAIYDADTDGMPTDADLKEALQEATCSQVATWSALTVDPAAGAADGGTTVASKSFGGASIQYSVYASTAQARAKAATSLSQDARLILTEAGLTAAGPMVL